MKLLSKELVSLDYREHLQRDLAKASVCRFLVAYVSNEGIESIGRHLLNRALRDQRSFGVASLTCSCGFNPLLRLQSELPEVRLKYFMDPLVKEDGEPSEISLFHSKLVYLYLEREAKSVVYIGSHNWTRRALGPQGPRNAEASIRLELDFVPEDLDGSGTSVASHVNKHLLPAFAGVAAAGNNDSLGSATQQRKRRRLAGARRPRNLPPGARRRRWSDHLAKWQSRLGFGLEFRGRSDRRAATGHAHMPHHDE
jgi:hypothetical protein